jgi:hypothetical protein
MNTSSSTLQTTIMASMLSLRIRSNRCSTGLQPTPLLAAMYSHQQQDMQATRYPCLAVPRVAVCQSCHSQTVSWPQ